MIFREKKQEMLLNVSHTKKQMIVIADKFLTANLLGSIGMATSNPSNSFRLAKFNEV